MFGQDSFRNLAKKESEYYKYWRCNSKERFVLEVGQFLGTFTYDE